MPYWIFHFFSPHFDQFRFISFRFFRYISLRFVWFRFVSISFRTLQVPYYMANNLSNSYSNDMLTVKLSGFPDMHWRDLFTSTSSPRFLCRPTAFFSTCWSRWTSESSTYGKQRICLQGGKLHIIILYSSTFYKKGHAIRPNLKIPNARVKPFRWLMCRNDARIFLLRVLSIKRVQSCNWLTEAQSTSNETAYSGIRNF